MGTILALDIGRGWTKALTSTGGRALFSSTISVAEPERYDSGLGGDDLIEVEVDGVSYWVGRAAELYGTMLLQTLDPVRNGSLEEKVLFYAAASRALKTNESEAAIVTGLPLTHYNKDSRARLRAMLVGAHDVKAKGKPRRKFTVGKVMPIPQGVGALYALALDRNGNVSDPTLADARVGLIDVGRYTVNFALFDSLQYVEASSDTTSQGMHEVLTRVAKDLLERFGLDWTNRLSEVDRAVRARSVAVKGVAYDISDIVDAHVGPLADSIVSHARGLSLWRAGGAELRSVVVAGGGSGELLPYVVEAFSHARAAEGDPQLANVTGYLRVGLLRFGR
jgi:PRTRC genetic system protein D